MTSPSKERQCWLLARYTCPFALGNPAPCAALQSQLLRWSKCRCQTSRCGEGSASFQFSEALLSRCCEQELTTRSLSPPGQILLDERHGLQKRCKWSRPTAKGCPVSPGLLAGFTCRVGQELTSNERKNCKVLQCLQANRKNRQGPHHKRRQACPTPCPWAQLASFDAMARHYMRV